MNRYETYKPSGIDWLGEIPSHWTQRKFKNVSYMKGRIGWQGLKNEEFTFNPDEPFLITGMNFKDGEIDWNEVYHIPFDRYNEAPEIQLQNGDVLMTKDGTIGKLLFVNKIPEPHLASLNSHLLVFRPIYNAYIPKYLYYHLQSESFAHHIELTKTGTTFFGITQEAVGIYKLLLPPIEEQRSIIEYLDNVIAAVEKLISNKKAQAEKLKELRQIEINNAVTKGLNSNAEMKESGIEWLGKIPKHWEVKRLKNFTTKIGSGVTPKGGSEVYEDSGVPILRSQNIHFDGLRLEDVAYISEEIHNAMLGSKVQPEDVLLNITGASIGRCYYYDGSFGEANVNQHVCIIRVNKKLSHLFLQLFLSSDSGQSQIFMGQVGTSREGLTFQDVKNIVFALPPIEEQIKIANYLQNRTTAIDQLIKNIEAQIEKLQELRKIKIYEAVTGRIKVNAYAETTA